jgi:hypothetical protein
MTTRIREQLEKITDLNANGELELSATSIALPNAASNDSLEKQVQDVANRVIEMVRPGQAKNSK